MKQKSVAINYACLLYTPDAAAERSSVDLGDRGIFKKKKREDTKSRLVVQEQIHLHTDK